MLFNTPSSKEGGLRGDSLLWAPLLIVATVAFGAVVPFTWMGNASGHDFEFHMYSWLEVVSQWKQGAMYPRWAAGAHWEYGEPRFIFYPPASWHLGALIGSALPWKLAPGVYIWIAVTLSGISMFLLARRFLDRWDALFAAALYAVNPYILIVIYWRSALAELLAACLMPALLLLVLQIAEGKKNSFFALTLVVAAGWLTNAPSAVMLMYSLAVLVLTQMAIRREWKFGWYFGAAIFLGTGLAAFYLIPAAYETRWINIDQIFAPGVSPRDNFLMTLIGDPDHNRFNTLVTLVAAVEIVILVCVFWMSRKLRKAEPKLWFSCLTWSAMAIFLMSSISLPLWDNLPKLRFVQLPWRWLLCLGVPFALLTTVGIRRWTQRALSCGVLVAVVLVGAYRIQQPWWDDSADIKEMVDAVKDHIGYEGTDEYVPVGMDPEDIRRDAKNVTAATSGRTTTTITRWEAQDKKFSVWAEAPTRVAVRLFNYPAWETTVNGRQTPTSSGQTGELTVAIPAGKSEIHISFLRTWDRALGIWITLAALFVTGYLYVRRISGQRLMGK